MFFFISSSSTEVWSSNMAKTNCFFVCDNPAAAAAAEGNWITSDRKRVSGRRRALNVNRAGRKRAIVGQEIRTSTSSPATAAVAACPQNSRGRYSLFAVFSLDFSPHRYVVIVRTTHRRPERLSYFQCGILVFFCQNEIILLHYPPPTPSPSSRNK